MNDSMREMNDPRGDGAGGAECTGDPGRRTGRILALKAYAAAFLFLAAFVACLAYGAKVSPPLAEPLWAIVVAGCVTVPALTPWLADRVLPRLKSIKVSEIEIALEEARAPVQPLAAAVQALSTSVHEGVVLSELAAQMTSLSGSISAALQQAVAEGHEVIPVDLATRWVAPNLYFLASLAAQKTRVRQIVFLDSRAGADTFVCSSSPEEIVTMLEWHHRELGEAARAARFDQHVLSVEPMAGHEFFANLKASYDRSNAQGLQRATLLSPEALRALLGPAAHRDAVAWPATPGEREYRAVVESESRYVAALDGRALHFLIDRDRVALAIARETIRAR